MKVILNGGDGYLGSAISEALKNSGHQVVAGEVKDADAVIFASESEPDGPAVEAAIGALAGSNRPLIYTSSVWVMGDTGGRMNGEVSGIHPAPLVAWKRPVEQMVLSAIDQKVRGMVFRPGMIFGRGAGVLKPFFESARTNGAVEVVGDGENYWSTVHVNDLADLYLRAIESPVGGELFISCGGMPQPVKKIAHAVAKAAGIEGKVNFIPLEEARKNMGQLADCLAMDCRAGSTKAIRFFGWSPKTPYIFDEIDKGALASPCVV